MIAPPRVIERIKSRVEFSDEGCWLWTGATGRGYGYIGWGRDESRGYGLVHRLIYQAEVGPIPPGLTIDHTCHNPAVCPPGNDCPHRRCVNPAHLEPVTHTENTMRGGTVAAVNAAKTHCPQGHAYDESNTYLWRGGRQCRQCQHVRSVAEAKRRKAERHARRGVLLT